MFNCVCVVYVCMFICRWYVSAVCIFMYMIECICVCLCVVSECVDCMCEYQCM